MICSDSWGIVINCYLIRLCMEAEEPQLQAILLNFFDGVTRDTTMPINADRGMGPNCRLSVLNEGLSPSSIIPALPGSKPFDHPAKAWLRWMPCHHEQFLRRGVSVDGRDPLNQHAVLWV